MRSTHCDVHNMPVPSFAYTNRNDGSVFILTIGEDGKTHKRTIGHMTESASGEKRMIPSPYFREKYQDLYNEYYPEEKVSPYQLSAGMYALTLGIVTKTGLYTDLQNVYGPVYANSILDYAMFSILYRSSLPQIYERAMAGKVLFCDTLHTDKWYSDFFSKKLNEDQHHQFRIAWIRRLISMGLKKVWLCIDGSDDDCEIRKSFLDQFGFPDSCDQSNTTVGFMYVVDGETGCPVTYFVYEGSVPDAPAFERAATFLNSFSLQIEGVILDNGFAVENVFKTITQYSWKYVIMLSNDDYAHLQMLREYGEKIRWKSEFILEDGAVFGVQDRKKLFENHERESDICLFFDDADGSAQSITLIRQIQSAREKAEQAIADGTQVSIEKRFQQYIKIEGEGAERKVVSNYEKWDTAMTEIGFYSMAVSDNISPDEAKRFYKLRDISERQYCILKSQEGTGKTRIHKTEEICSRFALLFISSLIRFEIEASCKELDLDAEQIIRSLDQVALQYGANAKYEAVRNMTGDQKSLFGKFDMDQDDIERIAREYNVRNRTDSKNPNRILPQMKSPVIQENTHRRGRRTSSTSDKPVIQESPLENSLANPQSITVKSKGGRPLGKKDTKPRKERSDKGVKRGSYKKN